MEEQRKTYFISLEKRKVSKVSTSEMEYEVFVTPTEIVKFEGLLKDNDDKDFVFAAKSMPFKPFAEAEVEEMREETHENFMSVYEFIYKFGTEEAREKLKEIGYYK